MNETAARLALTFRSLTDERNRTNAILESMIEGVAVVGADERVVFSNLAFAQILPPLVAWRRLPLPAGRSSSLYVRANY